MSKTMKIEVEVEVPDWAEYVAAEKIGAIVAYEKKPRKSRKDGGAFILKQNGGRIECVDIVNWDKTLKRID